MSDLYYVGDWYWTLPGATTQVYSSKAISLVPVSDATYMAWLARGNVPTVMQTEQDLWDVLIEGGQQIPSGKATSDSSKDRRIAAADLVQFNMLFNHENRLRALEGQPPRTKQQFITFVKSQMV